MHHTSGESHQEGVWQGKTIYAYMMFVHKSVAALASLILLYIFQRAELATNVKICSHKKQK